MGRGAGAALILQLQVVEWSWRASPQLVNSHATDCFRWQESQDQYSGGYPRID